MIKIDHEFILLTEFKRMKPLIITFLMIDFPLKENSMIPLF